MGTISATYWKCGLLLSCIFSACTQAREPQVHTVVIKQMQFQPSELLVNIGDTVVWKNQDLVVHDVQGTSVKWMSGPIDLNSSWQMAITEASDYQCSIHPLMKGKIQITGP